MLVLSAVCKRGPDHASRRQ